MRRVLALLALLLVGAGWLNARLERADAARRLASAKIERFLAPALAEGTRVAALTLRGPGGAPSFVYARTGGRWRCVSAFQAPCDDATLEGLVLGLLRAQSVVRSRDAASLPDYGLGEQALHITLHGAGIFKQPDKDVLCELRVGASSSLAGAARAGRCFATRGDSTEVHELDLDLRSPLERDLTRGFPPLLELRLVPAGFLRAGARIERILLEPVGAPAYELVRREHDPASAPDPGAIPPDWSVLGPEGEARCPAPRAEAISVFLLAAPYRGLDDARKAAELGLDAPRMRITALPSTGDPLVLHVGGPAPAGGVWVWNRSAGLLCSVDDEVAALLTPALPALVAPPPENPWDVWLRKR